MSQIIQVQGVHNRLDKHKLLSRKRLLFEPMLITEHKTNHRKLPAQGTFYLSLLGMGSREGWGEWLWRYCKPSTTVCFISKVFFYASFFLIMHITNLWFV